MPFTTKNTKNRAIFALSLLLIFCLSACGLNRGLSEPKSAIQGYFLNTVVELTVYGETEPGVLEDCLALCGKYELIFSRTDSRSELYALNASGGGRVSEDLRAVLESSLERCRASGGKFDITLGGVSELYGFSTDSPTVPTPEALAEALEHTGWEKIHLDGDLVTYDDPETVIDLGAAAKGYIADRMKDFLVSKGVSGATINLGGNVLCVGAKSGGEDFKIGIREPVSGSDRLIAAVSVNDMSVVTSGVYERCFERGGVTYHHLLDSATGLPIRNGLASVTVISEKSVDGDELSTLLFALGPEAGMDYVNSLDGVWAMFIDEDMDISYSDGFEENFID